MPTTAASSALPAPAVDAGRPSTRDRLLDAAESLLLARDIDEVSIRAINAAAGMNPAAVHYHFGSKEALIGALLERRLAPHWHDGLTRLTARHRAGDPPAVGELVDVVLTPLGELTRTEHGRLQLRLLARVVLARRDVGFASGWFGLRPWIALLRTAVPGLGGTEAARRLLLAFDLILHTLSAAGPAEPPTRGSFRSLRAFTVAGLSAPPR
ncbi:TetR/AcrR family transcriptional regulator [Prauserella alba]|uniref:HTH tetR-type domain-containing protein n=1 Tax=Prauserella alba TaxID=176898 RepID=A0ABP4FQH6_9PSEU|nr:TetR/AcrR family transcriptional regulator [Prauserella alba]MCP2180317.1 transcriptional regulator, TetR family [Prauserella alba]